MGTIEINNLSFKYDNMSQNIFNKFDLNIDEKWKLGLIGRNGRGKTTFLKILQKKLEYHGSITTNLKFVYFPQFIKSKNLSTQNVLLQLANLTVSDLWKIQIEMDKLHLNDDILNRPFNSLSPGEKTKAKLAVLFCNKRDFQLIDEPTNHLDNIGRNVVANYLNKKKGFIVVSHDRHFLNQVIDHVLSIDRAKIQLFKGNYDTWQRQFELQNEHEAQEKRHLQTDIKRLNKTAQKSKKWSLKTEKGKFHKTDQHENINRGYIGHKAAKLMKRSQSLLKRTTKEVNQKQRLLKNIDKSPNLEIDYAKSSKRNLLQVEDLVVIRNKHKLNQALSFTIKLGERIALDAANGSGKTTIIKAILGNNDLIANGSVHFAHNIKISYMKQNFTNFHGDLKDYALKHKVDFSQLLNTLHKLGFDRKIFTFKVEEMCQGQKRKLALAESLCTKANLYVWDEPLNYLDVITRQQIENLLLEINPTMLFVEHDRMFTKKIATRETRLIQA